MVARTAKTYREPSLEHSLLEEARNILRTDPSSASDPARVYRQAVSALVYRLLSQSSQVDGTPYPANDLRIFRQNSQTSLPLLSLSPEKVGQAYEYLRGLCIQLQATGEPDLVPSVRGKRNQGLFYTPSQVVRFIVKTTLDALRVSRPEDHLDLKILDPAVGAGVFLVEALEQVTNRVLVPDWAKNRSLKRRIEAIIAQAKKRLDKPRPRAVLDASIATKLHILENCLYGIDLDPLAVEIAREALRSKALGHLPWFREIKLKIRVGNSLMGEGAGNPHSSSKRELDQWHSRSYVGSDWSDSSDISEWCKSKGVFHWPLEYPEVFDKERSGFDAMIGNPPFEIISVKESGISERTAEQRYFRLVYRTCRGKINTYRLMLERGLNLLSANGTLGFILPATLVADSTAADLRRMVLDEAEIVHAVLIPEKARIFRKVTQALLVLVLKKGRKTTKVQLSFWDGNGNIPVKGEVEIPRALIDATGLRIPLVKSEDEKRLLELVSRYPPFKGADNVPPLGRVHQGEMNLTTHRQVITAKPTAFPLIRGEHVMPFLVSHPSSRPGRLDWVVPEYAQNFMADARSLRNGSKLARIESPSGTRGRPWTQERIVLGRVVNMATARRLKAAAVPSGVFLGDMTNFIAEPSVPQNYMLGLLNSRLLNWRLKLTSTNNYVSAAEIEALPIPRISLQEKVSSEHGRAQEIFKSLPNHESLSLGACLDHIERLLGPLPAVPKEALLPRIIERLVEEILLSETASEARKTTLTNLLDALVLNLYGIEPWPELIRLLESPQS